MSNDEIVISADGRGESRFVDKHRSNVKSDLIEITEDKLENILLKYIQNIELRKRWVLPFGLLVSVALTLTSAKFQDGLGISAATWNAVFLVLAALSVAWLLFDLLQLTRCWSKSTLDYLIRTIKNAQSDG